MSEPALILYDGLCGFCDASVQWLLTHDPSGQFRFAALQSDTAKALLTRHTLPPGLDSIVVVEGLGTAAEKVSWHSSGVFAICRRLAWPWRAGTWWQVLPRGVTDFAYKLFARNRYLVWGRKDACRIPTMEERARFLV